MQKVHLLLALVFWGSGQIAQAEAPEEAYREELAEEAMANPFKRVVQPVDPRSKARVDAVLLGPVYRAKRGSDFDYYRYVTFYNIEERRERIYSLPVHRENCEDNSEIFAGWSSQISYSAKISASLSVEGVGLGADFSRTHTLTISRNLKGHGKFVTDHIPYTIKKNWEGYTYLQTVNTKNGQERIVLKENGRVPFWVPVLFPILAPREYPVPFKIDDADWTWDVEPKRISPCPKN